MGNKTTVKDMSIGAAIAMLLVWLASYFWPDLMETLPTGGEAAIALLVTGLFSYIKPEA